MTKASAKEACGGEMVFPTLGCALELGGRVDGGVDGAARNYAHVRRAKAADNIVLQSKESAIRGNSKHQH